MAQSFQKDKILPFTFWAEVVRHSVYILNRLPTRALSGVILYEAWSTRKPYIGHIRVFGCLSHRKLPANKATKLSDRSKMVINLGKEPGTKSYRVYDPKNGSVHVSRDVIFEEGKEWHWEQNETTEGVTQGEGENNNFLNSQSEQSSAYENNPHSGQSSRNEGDSRNTSNISHSTESTPPSSNTPPSAHSSFFNTNSESSSEAPRRYKQLSEIYDATEEIELDDDELMLTGKVEPMNFNNAASEPSWQQTIKSEIESVEKKKHGN
ncbi:uncharacterized protein LOC141674813 [Apium graveolens]|uniref:uncharacterized protein LOC141674813 n=1 Tax=Apium graveolens TaxID=4045 RepID=UPI003D7BD2C3